MVNGAVLTQARHDKEGKYSELVTAVRCRLVVVALETGGLRTGEEAQFKFCGPRVEEAMDQNVVFVPSQVLHRVGSLVSTMRWRVSMGRHRIWRADFHELFEIHTL